MLLNLLLQFSRKMNKTNTAINLCTSWHGKVFGEPKQTLCMWFPMPAFGRRIYITVEKAMPLDGGGFYLDAIGYN